MQLQQASRKRARIKMALQGTSGSGKTYSSLLLAYGLCRDWSKIAVIDSENSSSDLYANLGAFNNLKIAAPFSPEKYIDCIRLCESAGMQVIIIDSISHEWEGIGGILDIHGNMAGNSFTNWSKLTPRNNAFIQSILQSPCHIICTIRSKQDYILTEKNGKMVPEKVGLKGIARDGLEYEFTIAFTLDIKHNAQASKDRTGLFVNEPEFKITSDTGALIRDWCESPSADECLELTLEDRINDCRTLPELLALYKQQSTSVQEQFSVLFSKRRSQVIPQHSISSLTKPSTNGIHDHTIRS